MIHPKDSLCTDCKRPIEENVYCDKCYKRLRDKIERLEKKMAVKRDKERIECPSCKQYKNRADFYWDEESKISVCFECYWMVKK